MKIRSLCLMVLLFSLGCGGKSDYVNTVEREHMRRQAVFMNPEQSPLDTQEISQFRGLKFFGANEALKVNALITWLPQIGYLDLPLTNGELEHYMQTAVIDFSINEKSYQLPVYQTEEMKRNRTLFVPFTDLTNGSTTYSGGRYIDLPYNDHHREVILDFNYAYIPYCAHTPRYACPKVPKENHLALQIEAGEKL